MRGASVAVVLMLVMASLSSAQSVVGKWRGVIRIEANSAVTKAKKPESGTNVQLALARNGSLVLTTGSTGRVKTQSGFWRLSGRSIVLSGLQKSAGLPSEIVGEIGMNGKSMRFDLGAPIAKLFAKSGRPLGAPLPLFMTLTKK